MSLMKKAEKKLSKQMEAKDPANRKKIVCDQCGHKKGILRKGVWQCRRCKSPVIDASEQEIQAAKTEKKKKKGLKNWLGW